jgi:hypothetical protein
MITPHGNLTTLRPHPAKQTLSLGTRGDRCSPQNMSPPYVIVGSSVGGLYAL